jgi:predicted metal-dependent phosphoesterase TrpH
MMGDYKSKILTMDEARKLQSQGLYAIDPHCHTSFSYDVPDVPQTSPEYVTQVQSKKGLKNIISDHDTLSGYNHLKKNGHKTIIPAVEIKIRPTKAKKIDLHDSMHTLHINVFGLTNEDFNALEYIAETTRDLDLFVQYLKQHDLNWMYNHPFWHEAGEHLNWKAIPGLVKHYFDVVELNAGRPKSLNDLALHLAEQFNKGIVAGTDSHTGTPGRAFVMAEGKTFNDFWENVKNRKMYVVRSDMTVAGIVKESSLTIKHIFRASALAKDERGIFNPATGVKPLDRFARAVVHGNLKNRYVIKKTMEMIMYTVNYTAGPLLAWKLYVHKEQHKIEEIKHKIIALTQQLKQIENKIQDASRNLGHIHQTYTP